jgi:hypothetical protein
MTKITENKYVIIGVVTIAWIAIMVIMVNFNDNVLGMAYNNNCNVNIFVFSNFGHNTSI